MSWVYFSVSGGVGDDGDVDKDEDVGRDGESWVCETCTLVNICGAASPTTACAACGAERPRSPSRRCTHPRIS